MIIILYKYFENNLSFIMIRTIFVQIYRILMPETQFGTSSW